MAKMLAARIPAVYLRIDTIEQAIRDLCCVPVQGEGYRLAYRIARDNLLLGLSVVSDSCNPIQMTRDEWHGVADASGAGYVDIEVVCSDEAEHRARVEGRVSEVPGLEMPAWLQVRNREYHPWDSSRITIDTAGKSLGESFQELVELLNITDETAC